MPGCVFGKAIWFLWLHWMQHSWWLQGLTVSEALLIPGISWRDLYMGWRGGERKSRVGGGVEWGDRRRQTAKADVSVSPAPCPTCIFKEQLCFLLLLLLHANYRKSRWLTGSAHAAGLWGAIKRTSGGTRPVVNDGRGILEKGFMFLFLIWNGSSHFLRWKL